MQDGPHVDAPAEPGFGERRLKQVAAGCVVHPHVVDTVPHDERHREPEDQQALLDSGHPPYLNTSAVMSSFCGAPFVKDRTSAKIACSRSGGGMPEFFCTV